MIARIILFIVIGTLLPYAWCHWYHARHASLRKKVLLWLPALVVLGYSAYLALLPDFVPSNPILIDIWFVVMALFAVPVFVYAFFSFMGWCLMRLRGKRNNWGKLVGLVLGVASFFCFIYGFTYGFRKLEVRHLTLKVPQLPAVFDGYRIVLFSDFHLGSFYGWRSDLPQRDVDSINAQRADMICFTGDLQNVRPTELYPYKKLLSSLRAKDGVYSILGNHDYSYYAKGDSSLLLAQERETCRFEQSLGWHLLNNMHEVVRRGNDSIYVAGTENYDKPEHTDVARALSGIAKGQFVLMLQHMPKQWKDMVPSRINEVYGSTSSPLVSPQLTLSGHTHAGQISILGLRPTLLTYFDYGLYEREGCQLYTTAGLGGVIPIRIGATAEIVVITLVK